MRYLDLSSKVKTIERRVGINEEDKDGIFIRLFDDVFLDGLNPDPGSSNDHACNGLGIKRVSKNELTFVASKDYKESRIDDLPEAIKLAEKYNVGGGLIKWGKEELAEYHSKK